MEFVCVGILIYPVRYYSDLNRSICHYTPTLFLCAPCYGDYRYYVKVSYPGVETSLCTQSRTVLFVIHSDGLCWVFSLREKQTQVPQSSLFIISFFSARIFFLIPSPSPQRKKKISYSQERKKNENWN